LYGDAHWLHSLASEKEMAAKKKRWYRMQKQRYQQCNYYSTAINQYE
jgi:hypothetical protein